MRDMVAFPCYELKRRDHKEHMAEVLQTIYEGQTYTDVTLVCQRVVFHAHKVMLSLTSPFFKELFAVHKEEHAYVVLDGYSPVVIQQLLHFVYRGFAISPDPDTIFEIAHSAKQLLINCVTFSQPNKRANLELLLMDKYRNFHSIPPTPASDPQTEVDIVSSDSEDEVCCLAEVTPTTNKTLRTAPSPKKRKLKSSPLSTPVPKAAKQSSPTVIDLDDISPESVASDPGPSNVDAGKKSVTKAKKQEKQDSGKEKKDAAPREEIYCALCDRKFVKQATLKKHLLKHFMAAQAAVGTLSIPMNLTDNPSPPES